MFRCCWRSFTLVSVFLLAFSLWGQLNRGIIHGTATDPSGAPVPNATVTVINVETSVTITGTTNGSGFYAMQDLNSGAIQSSVSSAWLRASGH